jgi:D-psicose/D-tagatose/L-ribulose 3-epimerase
MYRIGCCLPGGSFMPQGVSATGGGEDELRYGEAAVREAGFDYAEAAVGLITALDDAAFRRLAASDTRFETFNCFVPGDLPIAETRMEKLTGFVSAAVDRVARVGGKIIVFGSGTARRLTAKTEDERARQMEKLYVFIRACGSIARENGVNIAIEPLNRSESNIINTVAEGWRIVREVGDPNVKLLADAYHMALENEEPSILSKVSGSLIHVHVSEADRSWPGKLDDGWLSLFASELKKSGYGGRVSAECTFRDFASEGPKAAAYMRKLF